MSDRINIEPTAEAKIKKAEETDEEIIREILNGRKHLFESIMRRYNRRLYRIGRSFLLSEDEIDDIIQDTYIKAYENLSKFEYRASFSTWLIRIFLNNAIARKEELKRFEFTDSFSNENGHSVEHLKINNTDMKTPEQNTINNELRYYLETAIDSLPEKYRTVFMMREVEKISTNETAKCLNLTEVNVKVRLNRAKEILRNKLSEVYNDVEVFQFLGVRCDRIVENVMRKLNIEY